MLRLTLVLLGFVLAVQSHALAQAKLSTDEIVDSLRGLETAVEVNAPALHQRALERIKAAPGQNPLNRPSIAEELNKLPQLTIEIQFNPDSDVVRPESDKTLGRIADALWHPYLLEYRVLVVGHTEANGKREYNLKLSQRRATAIREALVTTFRVPSRRVIAVGLGEEQLRDTANPRAAVNRHVQLISIGPLEPLEPRKPDPRRPIDTRKK
jgi:outer membrane protein OmpA-like peptidoglycan-associated protein